MATVPELEPHCGSWVIVDRSTGEAIHETFQRSVAEKVNEVRFEVLTAHQWLVRFNESLKNPPVSLRCVVHREHAARCCEGEKHAA